MVNMNGFYSQVVVKGKGEDILKHIMNMGTCKEIKLFRK
jgi:hypothetical protein